MRTTFVRAVYRIKEFGLHLDLPKKNVAIRHSVVLSFRQSSIFYLPVAFLGPMSI